MHNLSIPYTADMLVTSGKSPQKLEDELRFLLAAKLFEIHRLSLGKAVTASDSGVDLGRLSVAAF